MIGHISAPRANAAAGQRLAGVRDALRTAGLRVDALGVAEGDGHVAGGERAATALLVNPGLSALVCYNDLTAIGALRAVRAAGLRVPEDVSVVGFDDIDLAAWTDPPLTTIRQLTAEMGRWAVERLTSVLRSPSSAAATRRVTLQPELVVRGSTAPPSSIRSAGVPAPRVRTPAAPARG